VTRKDEEVRAGEAVNPPYVLSVMSRKIGSVTRFTANIIEVERNILSEGESVQYANMSDGMGAMEYLARKLSGEDVEPPPPPPWIDNFLKNSGIVFGGWSGPGFGGGKKTLTTDKETGEEKTTSDPTTNGGGSIELRLYRYFGIQTGLNVLSDYAPYTPQGNEEQYANLTIMQIPVLARVSFGPGTTALRAGITEIKLVGFGFAGVGLNITAKTSDAESVDPARMSIIAGAGAGFTGKNFAFTIGYQWNGDISGSSLTVGSASYDYTRRIHIINFGLSYYLPFRKDT
jgi:hypothetical protein